MQLGLPMVTSFPADCTRNFAQGADTTLGLCLQGGFSRFEGVLQFLRAGSLVFFWKTMGKWEVIMELYDIYICTYHITKNDQTWRSWENPWKNRKIPGITKGKSTIKWRCEWGKQKLIVEVSMGNNYRSIRARISGNPWEKSSINNM